MRSLLSVALGSLVTGLATAGLQCLSARRSADASVEVRCRKPGRSVLAQGFADALAIDAASLRPRCVPLGLFAAGRVVHAPAIGRTSIDTAYADSRLRTSVTTSTSHARATGTPAPERLT